MTETERQLEKDRIIKEFNEHRKIFDEVYPTTDGAKYLKSIVIDPYGREIDMSGFPEYMQWWKDHNEIFKKYNELIKPYAKYEIGDTVVVGCGKGEATVKICEHSFYSGYYLGRHAKYDTDICYSVEENTGYDPWKYGSSGGFFGYGSGNNKHSVCSFEEKYILRKVEK